MATMNQAFCLGFKSLEDIRPQCEWQDELTHLYHCRNRPEEFLLFTMSIVIGLAEESSRKLGVVSPVFFTSRLSFIVQGWATDGCIPSCRGDT